MGAWGMGHHRLEQLEARAGHERRREDSGAACWWPLLLFMNKVGQWGVEETETRRRRRRRKRTREGYQKPKKREQMLYSFINGI